MSSSTAVPSIRGSSDMMKPITVSGQDERTHHHAGAIHNSKAQHLPTVIKKYKSNARTTLPSKLAIPVGLAQVFTGISMVVVGAFSMKYQSYLFFYSSGLWSGVLAGLCGIFAILSTKKGIPLPEMCGGHRYQVRVFLGTTVLALSGAVLLFVISTSGLLQMTNKQVGVEIETLNKDEEMLEKRKASGQVINAILLLLSLLQILLSFMSLGISIRVLCVPPSHSSLLSSSSSQNEEVRDIFVTGSGREYIEKKHRLLRWLGHQRIPISQKKHHPQSMSEYAAGARGRAFVTVMPRPLPRPPPHPPTLMPMPYRVPYMPPPHILPYMEILSGRPPPPPNFPIFFPMCPPPQHTNGTVPVRRSLTKLVSSGAASVVSFEELHNHKRRNNRRKPSSCSSIEQESNAIPSAAQSVVDSDVVSQKEIETQITEEDLSHSYSGLDRALAEDFISNSMVKSESPTNEDDTDDTVCERL